MTEETQKWENLTEDGAIKKHIVKEGRGRYPFNGEKVAIIYRVLNQQKKFVTGTIISSKTYNFVIGESSDPKGLSLALLSMKCGEESEFEVASAYGYGDSGYKNKVAAGETIFYHIKFEFILETLPKEKASIEAENLNKKAGEAFRSGDFKLASERYSLAKDAICLHDDEDLLPLRNKLNSNLSTCYSKLGDWKESLRCAESVLRYDKTNMKCMMRKLDALIKLKNLEYANKFIVECLKVSKNDPAFVAKKKELDRLNSKVDDSVYKRLEGRKFF